MNANQIKLAAIGLLAIILIWGSIVIVPVGHRGVKVRLGAVQEGVLTEGLHFKMPFIESVRKVDVRVKKVEADSGAASKDLQVVTGKIAINYHLLPDTVDQLYKNVGMGYESVVVAPAIQESFKSTTAKYTAEQLITQRQNVSSEIRNSLGQRLHPYGISVDVFNVVNFDFSAEFNRAIEAKQTAEQLALKAQRDLERIRIEAQQKIEQAKAEAESLRIQKQEVTPELIELRQIEVQSKAIDKWDGRLPNVTGGAVPFIQVGDR